MPDHAPVRIYTTTYCGFCTAAKRYFEQVKGVTYEEINLTSSPDERRRLAEQTGQRTVPQIFVGDTHIGGFTDLRALDARGGLDPLLYPDG